VTQPRQGAPWNGDLGRVEISRRDRYERLGHVDLVSTRLTFRRLPLGGARRDVREHMTNAIRILGLDPGLRRTGWGVIVIEGARLSHVAHGVIAPKDTLSLSERLLFLSPDEAAIEETFVTANGSSTLKLGHARAAAMIAPARAGLLVAEYSAKAVKKAVVGTGGADKTQVAFMIARLLPTAGDPTADAADALAVAIAHAHARRARSWGTAA
jgi:crossover junction endodeoxyribonuclease RuvC